MPKSISSKKIYQPSVKPQKIEEAGRGDAICFRITNNCHYLTYCKRCLFPLRNDEYRACIEAKKLINIFHEIKNLNTKHQEIISRVWISGGEPTLHQNFSTIAQEAQINIPFTLFYTNGCWVPNVSGSDAPQKTKERFLKYFGKLDFSKKNFKILFSIDSDHIRAELKQSKDNYGLAKNFLAFFRLRSRIKNFIIACRYFDLRPGLDYGFTIVYKIPGSAFFLRHALGISKEEAEIHKELYPGVGTRKLWQIDLKKNGPICIDPDGKIYNNWLDRNTGVGGASLSELKNVISQRISN